MIHGQVRPASGMQLLVAGVILFSISALKQPLLAHESVDLQVAELTRGILARPGDARQILRRGELNRILKKWPDARADYQDARRLDPELDEVDFCEARMLVESLVVLLKPLVIYLKVPEKPLKVSAKVLDKLA